MLHTHTSCALFNGYQQFGLFSGHHGNRARLQSGASMSTLHPGCRACSIWTRLWAMTMSATQDGANDEDVCGVGHGRLEK